MPPPVIGPCGGQNEPACPPVGAVIQALANLLWAHEHGDNHDCHLACEAAHALIDPLGKE